MINNDPVKAFICFFQLNMRLQLTWAAIQICSGSADAA
jgi:hypothetical protein